LVKLFSLIRPSGGGGAEARGKIRKN